MQPDIPNENREVNEVVSAVDRVSGGIDRIIKKLSPATVSQFRLSAATQSTHVKMRTQTVVLIPSVAGTATLNVGTERWPFIFAAGAIAPVALPFVINIDRGVDVSLTGLDGAEGYLIYTAE